VCFGGILIVDSKIEQLQSDASRFRSEERWTLARSCYETILEGDLSPIERAKTLANLMQMYENDQDIERAVYVGAMSYKIIQNNRLFRHAEGAHLRGYLRGSLNRLREEYIGSDKLQNSAVVAVLLHLTNPFVEFVHTALEMPKPP
jgi:hypothetical protein